ncbi:hypothetical protein MTR_1g077960 [Medicago truncatula]|uniref:Uncharacterized protein n=1 Tax=Medicago truncatula TaxID=3880 RepID=A0A072VMT3_MEDTR|nr:hypothetical protein MTR_1g077960 [Medicago truncatula]
MNFGKINSFLSLFQEEQAPPLQIRDVIRTAVTSSVQEVFPLNLTADVLLGIGLFCLANGSDYQQIANQFNILVSVAKLCVKQLCRVLCTNFRF